MRILELILAPIEGGAHTLVDGLAREWRAGSHTVDILALDPSPNDVAAKRSREMFGMDVPIVRSAAGFAGHFPVKQLSRLFGLRGAIARGNYDVVHAHCMQPNIYSRLAAIGTSDFPPVVVTLHSPRAADYQSRRARVAERSLTRRASVIVAVSTETATEYVNMFPAGASRVVVIPNGIPRRMIQRPAEVTPRCSKFIALSRIHPQKDIVTMIRGFDRFSSNVDWAPELVIAGGAADQVYAAHVKAEHRQLEARDNIRFLGSRSDVAELLAAAHVFVHTAQYEAHSVAILEAAAAALPIVASDLPTIRESIGSAAEFFRPGDAVGLSEALSRVNRDWSKATQRARKLAGEVTSRYSMRACAAAYLEILERAARR